MNFRNRELEGYETAIGVNASSDKTKKTAMARRIRLFKKMIPLMLIPAMAGCSIYESVKRENIAPALFQALPEGQLEAVRSASPYLKAHMRNGDVYVLQAWALDESRQLVRGEGVLLNAQRDTLESGALGVALDSVAIFETNVIKTSGTVTALTVFTAVTAAFTINCLTNPKACFGSCPTFYAADGDSMRLQAEGFSASIAPALEAADLDALYHASVRDNELDIEMRNEALETHVVRSVELLAVPRAKDTRVFADQLGIFWQSAALIPPVTALAPEGNCLAQLTKVDGHERFSRTDSLDLGAKENIDLQFKPVPHRNYGLVIGCRQTLLSTYLLYQAFAYMGREAGHWIAQIERKDFKLHPNSPQKILGGIEILMQDSLGHWEAVEQISEHGPLATDFHLVHLGRLTSKTADLRLRMTKGNWRLDYIALAELSRPVTAVRLPPHQVLKDGRADRQARLRLLDSTQPLVTFPGEAYTLRYRIPPRFAVCELFLESRGYYLEWIRKEWMAEENPLLLAEMLLKPDAALRRLAPEFKRREGEIEDTFWRSRYVRP